MSLHFVYGHLPRKQTVSSLKVFQSLAPSLIVVATSLILRHPLQNCRGCNLPFKLQLYVRNLQVFFQDVKVLLTHQKCSIDVNLGIWAFASLVQLISQEMCVGAEQDSVQHQRRVSSKSQQRGCSNYCHFLTDEKELEDVLSLLQRNLAPMCWDK